MGLRFFKRRNEQHSQRSKQNCLASMGLRFFKRRNGLNGVDKKIKKKSFNGAALFQAQK